MDNRTLQTLRQGANNSRILLSLDGLTLHQAQVIALELSPFVAGVKVNNLIDELGAPVLKNIPAVIRFADPKIHDIGDTVFRRVLHYKMCANLVTVHASMSLSALSKAYEASIQANVGIIAVTVLTDIDTQECRSLFSCHQADMVTMLARRALSHYVHGIVCSPQEAKMVRGLSRDALIITPGVRSAGADRHDQKRVATPAEAIRNGADLIVVGRQILGHGTAAARIAEAQRINAEVAEALAAAA